MALSITPVFSQSAAERSLAKIEKEFSDYTEEVGSPKAWTKYFASDGVMFKPEPVNAHAFVAPRLQVPKRNDIRLRWKAAFTELSKDEDLGYNIGPSVRENLKYDTVPKNYGFIFSIWKRVGDTTWRVALDAGVNIKVKTKYHETELPLQTVKRKSPGKLSGSVLDAELNFAKIAREQNMVVAYETLLHSDSRMLKNDQNLFESKAEILECFKDPVNNSFQHSAKLEVIGSGTSTSNDLAYSYGSYSIEHEKENGFYVHIWRRESGNWRLIFDVTGAVPK